MASDTDTPHCQRKDCDGEGHWRWWNGKGEFGPYCDGHAREQLDDSSSHKNPIQRIEDCSDGYVVPAGIVPVDATLPCIRTKEAFDIYLETDGEEPRQCDVGWCGKLERNCDHGDDSPEVATDGGTDQHVESAPQRRFTRVRRIALVSIGGLFMVHAIGRVAGLIPPVAPSAWIFFAVGAFMVTEGLSYD